MAITEHYVDLTIGTPTGTGTSGNPYGTIEFALATAVQGGNGDRFNCFGSVVLSAAITSLGRTPTTSRPCCFQGISTTPGDGGRGDFSGGGAVGFMNTSASNIYLIDLDIHSGGVASNLAQIGQRSAVLNCSLYDHQGTTGLNTGTRTLVKNCFVTDIAGYGISIQSGSVHMCRLEDGLVSQFTIALRCESAQAVVVSSNELIMRGSGTAISLAGMCSARQNSIYAHGTTGRGIGGTTSGVFEASNNVVEGFSGVGGSGIVGSSSKSSPYWEGNAVFDCTTPYSFASSHLKGMTDNEILTSSAFRDAPNGDLSLVVSGNVREGSLPNTIGLF
tara:strand:- start:6760 stop:7755 length:996 start_codon:yes stop_codon:yes gene_type:complete